jgi:hypothetical protein
MKNLTCIGCKHFWVDMGSPGYSELTPGDDFSIYCNKNHWEFRKFSTEEHFKQCLKTANTCQDYDEIEIK